MRFSEFPSKTKADAIALLARVYAALFDFHDEEWPPHIAWKSRQTIADLSYDLCKREPPSDGLDGIF